MVNPQVPLPDDLPPGHYTVDGGWITPDHYYAVVIEGPHAGTVIEHHIVTPAQALAAVDRGDKALSSPAAPRPSKAYVDRAEAGANRASAVDADAGSDSDPWWW